jgi:drug/metabolite transporter (DMT)-like permease
LLGFLLYLCYLFQTFGLETIPAGKSAFLTNLTIIFVPLTSVLFQRSTPVLSDIISSCIALTGFYFLTDPFYGEGLSKGELWTILSAFCFSFYIQYLQIFIEKKGHAKIFSFLQIFFMTFFASICLLFLPSGSFFFPINFLNIFSLFYLGAIAMVATLLLQSFYQYKTTPERATVIYLLEPVFAIFFGYLILNEKMSPRGFLGAFLMIFAVIWVYFIYRKKY